MKYRLFVMNSSHFQKSQNFAKTASMIRGAIKMKGNFNMKEKIYELLKKTNRWMSPTEIGIQLGYDYGQASSRVNRPLKKLLADGLIERIPQGKYKVIDD